MELRVPTHEREGGMALLGCQYDLEGDTLYSLKWYKESREFYRFVPKNEPPVYYFPRPGVNVDVSKDFFYVNFEKKEMWSKTAYYSFISFNI